MEGRGGTAPTWTHLDQVRGGHRSRWSGHCQSGGVWGTWGGGGWSQVCPQCPGGGLQDFQSTWRSPQDAHHGQVRVSRCPGCASGVSSVPMEGVSGGLHGAHRAGGVSPFGGLQGLQVWFFHPGHPGCPWCPWRGYPGPKLGILHGAHLGDLEVSRMCLMLLGGPQCLHAAHGRGPQGLHGAWGGTP